MYRAVIVEDEPWSLLNIKSIFPWARYNFESPIGFDDARKAMDYILREKPDVLFTDVKMPEISGLELVKYLREYGLKLKIVIISGHANFSFAQKFISYGVYSYMLKPVNRQDAEKLMGELKTTLDKEHNVIASEKSHENIPNLTFRRLLQYTDEHYREKLQLNELAGRFQINASYGSQLFHEYFNCGFSEYLSDLKMKKAAELLLNSDMYVNEIADFLNYDYVYFNKIFKKNYGITPKQFCQKKRGMNRDETAEKS